ncbi:alpha/beta hydrolase [Nonomuraea sp. NPDC048882]|uniref:alpha/beta fold hydrolase n=1 Tax=Nonomuraea sp. NPDC048882 TaxID=3154347 RepID=UPI0033FA0002
MTSTNTFTKAQKGPGVTTAATTSAHTPSGSATRQDPAPEETGAHASFGRLKRIEAGLLDVGYAELGPADGPAVVLLHGWPYDIHNFADAAPHMAAEGYRVIVPYLRGFGTTRFRSDETFRNGQQAAVALDIIALMDALGIGKAVLAGFDWGARTATVIGALWPERCTALVPVSGYRITDLRDNLRPKSPEAERAWWYMFYFGTPRGKNAMEDRATRSDLTRYLWELVSPTWDFDDATFERTAAAFDNPDHVAVVLHYYRWRLGLADGERRYDPYEERLAARPAVTVPTIAVDGGSDPFTDPPGDGSAWRDRFTGTYEHRLLKDAGHNLPQEAPAEFAQVVIDAGRL